MLTRKFYLATLFLVIMVGCNNPESQPELKDPVYTDLLKEESRANKELLAKEKELQEFKKNHATLLDNDYRKKLVREDIFKTKNEIEKLRQTALYYRSSAESRKIFARKEYLSHFRQGLDWPPKDLKKIYFQQKQASQASKQWLRGIASEKPPSPAGKK